MHQQILLLYPWINDKRIEVSQRTKINDTRKLIVESSDKMTEVQQYNYVATHNRSY